MLGRKLLSLAALLAALLFSAQSAEAQRSRGRGGFGPAWLLMFPEVHRELKLDQDQIDRLQQLAVQMRAKSREVFAGIQDLPPEERGRRFRAFDKEYRSRIDEILDRKQADRLAQIGLQREGIRAIGRPDIARELKLSADQRQRVEAILHQERASIKDLFGGVGGVMAPGDREAVRARIGEIRRTTESRLNAVLTDSQRREWQGMLGAPFKFPEFRGRRRGGS